MHYHVTILLEGDHDEWNVFNSYEFEDGTLEHWVSKKIHQLFPGSKYTRDNAGVIMYVDGTLVVEIDAL